MSGLQRNILEVIDQIKKEKKSKELAKRDRGITWCQNKAIAIGESIKLEKELGVTQSEIALRDCYYTSLSKYNRSDSYNYDVTTAKTIVFWRRVEEFRQKAGVDATTYIKSQFYWFNKHFGCPPALHALCTENAVKRAIEFQGCKGNVVSSVVPYKSELVNVLRSTDELIRRIMKAQNLTKEQFYKQLVLTGEFVISKEYLKRDPVYLKLVGSK